VINSLKKMWIKYTEWLFSVHEKICEKCKHDCHCAEELHSDEYGVCTCDKCEC